jgi:dTDP-4-amino-4,6-dideoxygalactose transaminase
VRYPSRDRLAELLRAHGVSVGLHYSPPVHRQPALAGLPAETRPVELPESDGWAREELSLPMFAELRPDELERTIAACATACETLAAASGGSAASESSARSDGATAPGGSADG